MGLIQSIIVELDLNVHPFHSVELVWSMTLCKGSSIHFGVSCLVRIFLMKGRCFGKPRAQWICNTLSQVE